MEKNINSKLNALLALVVLYIVYELYRTGTFRTVGYMLCTPPMRISSAAPVAPIADEPVPMPYDAPQRMQEVRFF